MLQQNGKDEKGQGNRLTRLQDTNKVVAKDSGMSVLDKAVFAAR